MTLRAAMGDVPLFDPAGGVTVLAPERDAPGHWVGAPSVWLDGETLYLSVRHRRPLDRGRGFMTVIYETVDGVALREIWRCTSDQLNTESIERGALVRAPDGPWRCYLSYVDPVDRRWRIDLLEAETIEQLDPAARQPVLDARGTDSEGVKDPVVLLRDGLTHLFAGYAPHAGVQAEVGASDLHGTGNVFATGLVAHPTGHWVSPNGREFSFRRDILSPGSGWDSNVARLSAIMPIEQGYLLFYDGRTGIGDVYEDRTGLAFSSDLADAQPLSGEAPILAGAAGTGCLRYLAYARVGEELLYYYETGTAAGAHELRLSRVPAR